MRLRLALPALALALLAAVAYGGALRGPFVFDDVPQLQLNPHLQYPASWLPGGAGHAVLPNRSFGYLTFALNQRVAGLDAAAFRAVNVAIHLANALLVYLLVVLAFRTPRIQGSVLASQAQAVALVAAALFVSHPLQSQAVTYVVQRFTSLATLLYLVAVVLYLRWRLETWSGERIRPVAVAAFLGSIAAALLAMRTKEIAFTLPFVALATELALFGRPTRRAWALLGPLLAVALIVPMSLLPAGARNLGDAPAATGTGAPGLVAYLWTQATVVPQYLRLLVAPVGQSLDHDVPLARGLLDPGVVPSLALLAAIAALLAWMVRAASRERLDPAALVVALGLTWFFAAQGVEILVPLADVMVEHRVYLPSVGFFVAVATAGAALAARLAPGRFARAYVVAGLVLATGLALATRERNRVWGDEVALWTDVVAKGPGNARGHLNLGATLYERGRVDEAIPEIRRAVELRPGWAEAHLALAAAYTAKGWRDRATTEFNLGRRLQDERERP